NDIRIGAKILCSIALDEKMLTHNGEYFDNDIGRFSADLAIDEELSMAKQVIETINTILADFR
ncbi:MAG: oxidoreductase, partial [Psychromonas sp.]